MSAAIRRRRSSCTVHLLHKSRMLLLMPDVSIVVAFRQRMIRRRLVNIPRIFVSTPCSVRISFSVQSENRSVNSTKKASNRSREPPGTRRSDLDLTCCLNRDARSTYTSTTVRVAPSWNALGPMASWTASSSSSATRLPSFSALVSSDLNHQVLAPDRHATDAKLT
jgi:hypothetical protein